MKLKIWLAAGLIAFTGAVIAAEINDLSQTDANNANPSYGFPENMAPSAVNNNLRALEGILGRWRVDLEGGLTSIGSANAIIVSSARTITSYYDGLMLSFTATLANTASPTLNVDGQGARYISKHGDQTLAASDIRAGQRIIVSYDSSNSRFQMVSAGQGGALFTDPMTTRGDIIYRDASAAARLAVGTTANSILRSDGTDPQWRSMDSIMDGITSTRGSIIFRGPSVWSGLTPASASGRVLTSAGAGTDPSWEAASTGALVFVSSSSLSNVATVDIQSLLTGNDYLFQLDALLPATDDVDGWIRVEESAAFQSGATAYSWSSVVHAAAAETVDVSDSEIQVNATSVQAGFSNASTAAGSVLFTVPNVGASVRKVIYGQGAFVNADAAGQFTTVGFGGAYVTNTNAVTGIRFLFSSGNISTGTLVVWRRQRS